MTKKKEEKPIVSLVERISVPISMVEPNPWNPNVQDAEIYRVLAESLKEEGFGEPLLVRWLEESEKYQIVNGEHRYRLALETNMPYVPVAVVKMDDLNAKLATIRRNKTRGGLDTIKTAGILSDMRKRMTDDEITMRLGYSSEELNEMSSILNQPILVYGGATAGMPEKYEIEVPQESAKFLDDSLINLAGKRVARFEGRPSRKARGLVKALEMVTGKVTVAVEPPVTGREDAEETD